MVTLFEENRPEIQISIVMKINGGRLEVTGMDYGKLVFDIHGKSDYEYNLSVTEEQKEQLKQKLQVEDDSILTDGDLLQWFQRHYSKNEAFSEIQNLLKRLDIKYEVFIW